MYRKVLTKATILICLVLATSLGLGCPPDAEPRITVTDESLAIRVTEIEGGITIENLSGVDCTVYVRSPEGEQQFELAVGEVVTVTGIRPPIEVVAVSLQENHASFERPLLVSEAGYCPFFPALV